MRPKSIILLVLALGCGLVAAIGINQVIAGRGDGEPVPGETVPIIVAVANINTFDPVSAAVVKLEPWPKDRVPPGAFTSLEDVEGRRAKTKLFADSPILEAQVLEKGATSGSADETIPPGFRAVAVRVDDQASAANLILPGSRVDVLVHLQENGSRGIAETTTRTFLQDIKVFAVNDVIDRGEQGEERITARTVSLLVKPDQAELLTFASELGRIRFVMRSPSDPKTEPLEGATTDKIVGSGTQRGNREAETAIPADVAATNPFQELLSQQPKLVEPQPAAALVVATPLHRMTVIRGPAVEEVELDPASKVARTMSESAPSDEPPLSADFQTDPAEEDQAAEPGEPAGEGDSAEESDEGTQASTQKE